MEMQLNAGIGKIILINRKKHKIKFVFTLNTTQGFAIIKF